MFKSIKQPAILMALGILLFATSGVLAEEPQNLQVGTKVRATVVKTTPDPAPTSTTSQQVDYSKAAKKSPPKQVKGTLVDMDETTITLEISPSKPPIEILRMDVSKLEVSYGKKSRHTGALIGLGVGAGLGAIIGFSGGDDPDGIVSFSAGAKAGMGAFAFGVVGAIIGSVVTPGDKWETVQTHNLQLGFSKGAHGETGFILSARF